MVARRPDGSPPIPIRSIRVHDEVWNRAKQRAAENNETMSAAMVRFLECYANGGDASCEQVVVPKAPVGAGQDQ